MITDINDYLEVVPVCGHTNEMDYYGMATITGFIKIIGLFGKNAL